MWNSLRSDLKEFASSIATDGNTIRENLETKRKTESITHDSIDQGSQSDGDSNSNSKADNTIGDDDEAAYGDDDGDDDKDIDFEVIDEALRRADDEETYLTPLLVKEINGVDYVDPAAKYTIQKVEEKEIGEEMETEADGKHEEEQDSQEDVEQTEIEDGHGPSTVQTNDVSDTLEDEELIIASAAEGADMDATSNIEIDRSDAPETDAQDDPAVLAFLDSFSMADKSQEIGKILMEQADSTGKHFDSLVPNAVTYEQFWQRYFFRCDPDRIEREWDEEEEKARRERQEMIDKGKQKVQNLFGGALKAITGDAGATGGGTKEENIYEKYQAELKEKRRALQEGSAIDVQVTKKIGGIGGLFGRVRPPFVMNTAVDDEEDEIVSTQGEVSQSDDASEEEDDDFGWGSDDDDDENDDNDNLSDGSENDAESEGTEEVTFSEHAGTSTSPELEKLRAELLKALALKDELQQTLQQQDQHLRSDGTQTEAAEDDSEVERLKLALFEKSSELSALKASIEDAKGEDDGINQLVIRLKDQGAEIERMRSDLVRKDEQYGALRENLKKAEALQDEEDAKDNDILGEALETINTLQAELEETKTDAGREFEEMENRYKEEVGDLREEIFTLGVVTETVQTDDDAEEITVLNNATKTIASLQHELDSSNISVLRLQEELATVKSLAGELGTKEKDTVAVALENVSSLQAQLQDTKNTLAATIQTHLKESTQTSSDLQNTKNTLAAAIQTHLEEITETSSELQDTKNILAATIQTNLEESKQSSSELQDIKNTLAAAIQTHSEESTLTSSELQDTKTELAAAMQKHLEESKQSSSDLQDTENKLATAIQTHLEDRTQTLNKLADASERGCCLKFELEEVKAKLALNEDYRRNQSELEADRIHGAKQELEQEVPPSSSPNQGSFSSGVEVQSPVTKVMKENSDEEEDAGWGEDWSDDEDDL